MSKKNLARTALEAGREHRVRYELNRTERRRVSNHLHKVRIDPEYWYEKLVPTQPPVDWDYEIPGENLSPVYRWIDSHVGQVWDDVYSKLCSSWPKKTLAGFHIIEDHIKDEVAHYPSPRYYWQNDTTGLAYRTKWYVDNDGILRRVPDRVSHWKANHRKRKAPYPDGERRNSDWVVSWLGGTWIKEDFWGKPYTSHWDWKYRGPYVRKVGSKHFLIVDGRQGRKLTKDEVKIWESIYPWVREKFESKLEGE